MKSTNSAFKIEIFSLNNFSLFMFGGNWANLKVNEIKALLSSSITRIDINKRVNYWTRGKLWKIEPKSKVDRRKRQKKNAPLMLEKDWEEWTKRQARAIFKEIIFLLLIITSKKNLGNFKNSIEIFWKFSKYNERFKEV